MRAKQLVAETRSPLPAEPGQAERFDCEYERRGTANLFMLFEPLAGKRHVEVTERRTAVDFAHVVRDLADVHYPAAKKIVLVMDNLNTHRPASLYQAFAPEEARRLAERLEIHYTPKHGSWLDMAEIELSALATQCLDRRIADVETLTSEVAAWQARRNGDGSTVDWRFKTEDGYYCPSPEIVKSAHRSCFLASGEQRGTEFYAGQAILSAATLQPHISFAR